MAGTPFQMVDLFEAVLVGTKVDREKRIVENVVLCGAESPTRKRRYPRPTLEAARPLYEGRKIFLNHRKKGEDGEPRDVRDLAGRIVKGTVKIDEAGKVRGNVKAHRSPAGDLVLNLAEDDPEAAGMSHDAVGSETITDAATGWRDVDRIAEVRSVDLVSEPGTTIGFFESANRGQGAHMELSTVTLEQLRAGRPDLANSLITEGRAAVEARELKESREKAAGLERDLVTARTENQRLKGATIVERVLSAATGLKESAKKRIRDSFAASTVEITEAAVNGAVAEMTALLTEHGVNFNGQPAAGGGTTPTTPITTGGSPQPNQHLMEAAASFYKLGGYKEPAKK